MAPVRFRQRRLAASRRRRRKRVLVGLLGFSAAGPLDRLRLPATMAQFRFHVPLPLCVRLTGKKRHSALPSLRRRPLGPAVRASRRAAAYRRASVNPITGRAVPPGTPGAITRETYYQRQPVDAKTGRRVPWGTAGAVPRGVYYERRSVDPITGRLVPEGTPGAITWCLYRQRKIAARRAKGRKPTGRRRGRPRRPQPPASAIEVPEVHGTPGKPRPNAKAKSDPLGAPS
jgi:hypothetical protein